MGWEYLLTFCAVSVALHFFSGYTNRNFAHAIDVIGQLVCLVMMFALQAQLVQLTIFLFVCVLAYFVVNSVIYGKRSKK